MLQYRCMTTCKNVCQIISFSAEKGSFLKTWVDVICSHTLDSRNLLYKKWLTSSGLCFLTILECTGVQSLWKMGNILFLVRLPFSLCCTGFLYLMTLKGIWMDFFEFTIQEWLVETSVWFLPPLGIQHLDNPEILPSSMPCCAKKIFHKFRLVKFAWCLMAGSLH